MILKSFSKINLTLRVLNKKKNKMHNIETNSVLVDLHDKIYINKNKKNIILFKGVFRKNIGKKNTVFKTIKILRKLKVINGNYKIVIDKNIPIFAGLGGGTGNSFSLVKYFLKNRINENLIKLFENQIGSDFRLFLNNISFQKNLNRVIKNKNNLKCYFIIIFPFINCKTKNIYKMVKTFSSPSDHSYLKKMKGSQLINKLKKDRNDLQKVVEKKYPKIAKIIQTISSQKGCLFSRMTGSGSSCYGVFNQKKTAKDALINLKRKYPNYWCDITKTI